MELTASVDNVGNDVEVACLSGNEKNLLNVDFQIPSRYNNCRGQWSGVAKIQLPSDVRLCVSARSP